MTTSSVACGAPPVGEVEGVEVVVGEPVAAEGGRAHARGCRWARRPCRRAGRRPGCSASATATPSTPAMVSTSDCVEAGSLVAELVVLEGRLAADVGVGARRWRRRRGRRTSAPMVSVSTSVPAMKATPRRTARLVVRSRSLRAARSLRVVRNMAIYSPKLLHAVEHPVGRRCGHLVDDAAVGEEDDAVGVAGRDGVVGDHHDGLAELAHGLAHEGEDLGARAGVEVAGRLVGEDDLRPAGQGPGHGDPLLLAAGELARAVRRGGRRGRRCRRRGRARLGRACGRRGPAGA